MKIGIDISQLAYPTTGVATYLENFIVHIMQQDTENEYILFYSSLRRKMKNQKVKKLTLLGQEQNQKTKCVIKSFPIPPSLLDIVWNRLHILPIELFVGDIDIFITSDWTEPPAIRAKKVTIIYDLIVYKYPKETDRKIVETQKRKLFWVRKETRKFFCISKATKQDVIEILKVAEDRVTVLYPGV